MAEGGVRFQAASINNLKLSKAEQNLRFPVGSYETADGAVNEYELRCLISSQ
jgi:hypothetical protein